MITEDELIKIESLRLDQRKKHQQQLQSLAQEEPVGDSYIYFPKAIDIQAKPPFDSGLPWLFNGFIAKYGKHVIAVDPGVGFVSRLIESNFSIPAINKLFVSHAHLDHYADANLMMDILIRAKKPVKIIAPMGVFERKSISEFHSGRLNLPSSWEVLHTSEVAQTGQILKLGEQTNISFFKLHHGEECLGFTIHAPGHEKVSYISDTGYSKTIRADGKNVAIEDVLQPMVGGIVSKHQDVKDAVKGSEVLVVNINGLQHVKNSKTHLSAIDLLDIVEGSAIRKIIIAHVSPIGDLGYERWGSKLADYIQQKSGITTLCPDKTGLKLGLN
jgi:ribonuclease BN (tRNA processing enzyme)